MPPILQRMRYYEKMNLVSSPVSVSSPSEMISANRIARNTRTANPKTDRSEGPCVLKKQRDKADAQQQI